MRFVQEAPVIAARLRTHPQVRDVAIVPYPDRRAGTGLYAFVEGSVERARTLDFLGAARPEHLQVVDALPRNAQGDVRSEILELVAINQLDLIDPLLKTDAERAVVGRIVSERRNSARPLCVLMRRLCPFRAAIGNRQAKNSQCSRARLRTMTKEMMIMCLNNTA